MVEIYFRKVKYTFNTLGIFVCGLGYLWFVYELFARDFLDMRQKSGNDAIFYFIIAVVIFGALLLLYLNWIYLRQFVKCIILHRPALVLADESLHIYDTFVGNYIVLPWTQIETFEPFEFKGRTTHYVVLKDYDVFYQQLSGLLRRYIMWTNNLIVRRSVINIDAPMMDIDADELLKMLDSRLSRS